MATSKVFYTGDLRTEAVHLQSGEHIKTDAPTDNHGLGEHFSPTDLLCTALASCILTIMGLSAKTHGFSIEGSVAEVEKVMSANPRRIAEIIIEIHIPNGKKLNPRFRDFIELSARECPVAKSLHPETRKTIYIHYE